MRGTFNTTCDVFHGPASGTPGALRGTRPCRFVKANGIFLVGPGAPTRVGWVTMETTFPRGPWLSGVFGYNPQLADVVAIPSGTAPQFWVLFTEEVLWKTQSLYYRANLAYLPAPTVYTPPPVTASGGIIIGGTGGDGLSLAGIGGIEVGGEGDLTP